jgi:hypothetical protein
VNTHKRRLIGVALATTAATSVALASSILTAQAAPRVRASLNFNAPAPGQTVTTLAVGGDYAKYLSAKVVTANGGKAVSAANNISAYRNVIDFPPHADRTSNPPTAIVSLRNTTSTVDPLNPGSGNFTWQADFSLDDNVGTDNTDGDNLVQRGLIPEKQWKLSVDLHQAGCYVRTVARGTEAVTPLITIPNQTSNIRWYRAICNRSLTGVLTLRVYAYWTSKAAWVLFRSSTAPQSASGSLAMARTVPVAIGGKLKDDGTISLSPAADQFNGKVDNVILTVG